MSSKAASYHSKLLKWQCPGLMCSWSLLPVYKVIFDCSFLSFPLILYPVQLPK